MLVFMVITEGCDLLSFRIFENIDNNAGIEEV